jgi:hypothetical protein
VWTAGVRLRIRRLGVRVPPSAPQFPQARASLSSCGGPLTVPQDPVLSHFLSHGAVDLAERVPRHGKILGPGVGVSRHVYGDGVTAPGARM